MNIVTSSYAIYLLVSVALTMWVSYNAHRNGRVFLVEAFHGNEAVADSVNSLLVVGFYLINIGYVTLALKYSNKPHTARKKRRSNSFSTKVGLVLLILGGMHFFNVFNFAKIRRKKSRSVIDSGVPLTPLNPQPCDSSVEAMRTVREHE